MKVNCVVCGVEFEAKQPKQNVCGKECRAKRKAECLRQCRAVNPEKTRESCRKSWAARRERMLKEEGRRTKAICVICTKEFEASDSRRKACGKECRKKLKTESDRRSRKANWKSARANCAICGAAFEKKTSGKFCGEVCKKARRNEFNRKYHVCNKEQEKERQRKYVANNREKVEECKRKWQDMNKNKILELRRKQYAANPEKEKERQRKYVANNREKVAERQRKHRTNNREKIQERERKHRVNNREKLQEYMLEWRTINKEKMKEYDRNRKAMLGLEKHGLSPVIFLSQMIDQRIASIQDTEASTRNNKEHQ